MEKAHFGFHYDIETVLNGQVIDTDRVYNLIPIQGLNYIIEASLRQGAAFPAIYVGLYEGSYNPVPGDTMATFPSAATELTAYAESTRQVVTLAAASGGVAESSAAKATITGNTNGKQAQGAFISSSPTKGASTGVLLSAVRFPSPKPLDAGTVLRITCGFTAASV